MERREFLTTLAGTLLTWGVPACRHSHQPSSQTWSDAAALDYLIGRQSPDGAWRSKVYGMFRGGEALTPLVLTAIHRDRPTAAKSGIEWIAKQSVDTWTLFPVHNACWLLELAMTHEELNFLREPLIKRLLNLQMGRDLGWESSHPFSGGWSYAGRAPKHVPDQAVPAMQQPNLSATVLAMIGLKAASLASDHQAFEEALVFVDSCQNFDSTDPAFDDGGFHQMQDDLMRNKGGQAGTDQTGTLRFKSYAAATADGLRGMLLAGRAVDHPRVRAAMDWLLSHPTVSDVADLHCYAAFSRMSANELLGNSKLQTIPISLPQQPDGSISNPHGEMREDDPLVATSLALMSRS